MRRSPLTRALAAGLALCSASAGWSAAPSAALAPEDREYFSRLARETWDSLVWLIHPDTGLPYNSSRRGNPETSVSNVGMYAAALAGAVAMGFLDQAEASRRGGALLGSLEKWSRWNGFCQSWHNVETLAPSARDPWVSVLDSGNLAGGLLALKHTVPRLKERAGRYLDAMDWSVFYDARTNALFGGYNMREKTLNRQWRLDHLGADSRLAVFLAVGSGKAPPAVWDGLSRRMEERYGLSYLTPGWQGGGLFMQYISGLFIDERWTFAGLSAARFAYAQMFHRRVIGSPAWGWSASDSPRDGYLGWQAIRDRVATPHAAALAAVHFPAESAACLRAFEALGARAPFATPEGPRAFGFRDAVDFSTGEVAENFLFLDQAMLFLSLVNVLADGAIWRSAERDPVVREARRRIADFRPENVRPWTEPPRARGLYVRLDPPGGAAELEPGRKLPFTLRLTSDESSGAAPDAVLWRVLDAATGRYVAQGRRAVEAFPAALPLNLPKQGVFVAQAALLKGESLAAEDSRLVRVSPVGSPARARPLPEADAPSWGDVLERWDRRTLVWTDWTTHGAKDAQAAARAKGDGVVFEFDLNGGEWSQWARERPEGAARLKRLAFLYRYKGDPVWLEVKLEDADGSVYGVKRELRPEAGWRLSRADVGRMTHWWGGTGDLDMDRIARVALAVSGAPGAAGVLEIKSMEGFFVHGQ